MMNMEYRTRNYELKIESDIELNIYDVLGRKVKKLIDKLFNIKDMKRIRAYAGVCSKGVGSII